MVTHRPYCYSQRHGDISHKYSEVISSVCLSVCLAWVLTSESYLCLVIGLSVVTTLSVCPIQVLTFYPTLTYYGRDTKFTVSFYLFCTVTDFSAGALPIGVRFCMVLWPHLRQVFSHFGGQPQGWPNFGRQQGILGVNLYGGICFLLKHL